ncbi:MAG TPA: sulfite exporter TauE/SafE family protein [Candidatus Tyrphobacter sp.]
MAGAVALFLAAFLASVFGSMVGLGGGFILVPVLRLFFGLGPAEASGTALVLVVANSASGAFTYLLQKRVHVRLGLLFAAGGWPGSVIGALITKHIAPALFDSLLAVLLVLVALDMVLRRAKDLAERDDSTTSVHALRGMHGAGAVAVGFAVGLVSSLFGIGGGIVLVPTLLYFSDLPAHAISATSHFGIVLTSPVGLATHAWQRDILIADILPLVAGGLCGGPIGARLSLRLRSPQLLVLVAIALVVGALSLVVRHL